MADITIISHTFNSLQAASNLAKALIGLRDTAMIESKVIELREHLIEAQNIVLQAQSEQSTLIQRIGELEEEITKMKAWEEEKKRYRLTAPWDGCYVYALKEESKGTEPPHWICEHCYQDGRKSILQHAQKWDRRIFQTIKCSHCDFGVDRQNDDCKYV